MNNIGFQNVGDGNNSTVKHNGVAIERASFTDTTVADYFELRVVDDRTLEIVPTIDALEAGQANKKFPTGSTIQVEGKGWKAVTGELKLTIKKTVPKIKASALRFNSFVLNDTLPLAFTGGAVSSIRRDTAECPDWLILDPENGKLSLTDSAKDQKSSGKVLLSVTVDGWREELGWPVTVSVSAAKTAPKLTFKPNTLTLNPKAGDVAETVAAVDMAEFRDSTIQLEEITLNNKTYIEGDLICSGVAEDGVISVTTAPGFNDEAAKTFKIFYSVAGEKYSFTVKTLAAPKTTPSFTLKASGTIDTGIPGSSVTITVVPKNYTTATYTTEAIKQYNAATKAYDIEAKDFFLFDDQWSGNSLTLKQKSADLTDGKFQVTVSTTVAGVDLTKDIAFTVKATEPSKAAPSVTLKAVGKLDVIRPESFITLTPTMKNWYDHELSADDLIFFKGTGKNAVPITIEDDNPFEIDPVQEGNKTFTIRLKSDVKVNYKSDKYSVGMRDGSKPDSLELTKSRVTLSITMGTAKFTQSTKTVDIVNRDRYSYGTLRLTPTDDTFAPISWVELDTRSSSLLEAVKIDDYQIAFTYKEDKIPDKKISAKLSVFLKGNPTVNNEGNPPAANVKKVANATISVTVNVIKVESLNDIEPTVTTTEINGTTFPDDTLRTELEKYDTNGDGALDPDEKANITELNLAGTEGTPRVSSLKGIETLPALTVLDCSYNNLTKLDVRMNTALVTLDCSHNKLTELNVSMNTALVTLNCSYNNLSGLDLTTNTALTEIKSGNNTSLAELKLPQTLTNVSEHAFENCGLKQVTIPASVTEIKDSAFENCTSLESVFVGDAVERIGVAAFKGCTSLSKMAPLP